MFPLCFGCWSYNLLHKKSETGGSNNSSIYILNQQVSLPLSMVQDEQVIVQASELMSASNWPRIRSTSSWSSFFVKPMNNEESVSLYINGNFQLASRIPASCGML